MSDILSGPLPFIVVALYAAMCIYIAIDMDGRVRRGWLYGVLAAVAPIVGVIIWLIVRESHPSTRHD
jgi:chromate transport protein ChrA